MYQGSSAGITIRWDGCGIGCVGGGTVTAMVGTIGRLVGTKRGTVYWACLSALISLSMPAKRSLVWAMSAV